MSSDISTRKIEDKPQLSEKYYKVVEKEDYVAKPKERLKSVFIAENNSDKKRYIRLIDKWVGYRFKGKGKGEHYWKEGKSFNILNEGELSMILNLLKKFGKLLGMKFEGSPEELVKRYKSDIEKLNLQLIDISIKYEDAKVELERQKHELGLAKQLIGELEKFSAALKDLKGLIESSKRDDVGKEAEIKKIIRDNRWMLGLDCQVKAKEIAIDVQAALDLHVKTDLAEDRVFEFKSPHLTPFYKESKSQRLKISPVLSEGLNQLITYMKKSDIYSTLEESGTYKIKKPAGVIVVGYNLSAEEDGLFKNWNFYLRPHIRLITYNDLLDAAEQNLSHIKGARAADGQ